jgi:hypothetical protein
MVVVDGRWVGEVATATVLVSPGGYGDGPVHIRVEKKLAGVWRPPFGLRVEYNDRRCTYDLWFDYVEVVNSINAFRYVREMVSRGVPEAALAVVRLAPTETGS